MKITGKCIEPEKNNGLEWGNPDPKGQIWHIILRF